MNKYITLLLLGVVLVAMALVLGLHMKENSGQSAQTLAVTQADEKDMPGAAGGQVEAADALAGLAAGASQGGEVGGQIGEATGQIGAATGQIGAATGQIGEATAQAGRVMPETTAAEGGASGAAAGEGASTATGRIDNGQTLAETRAQALATPLASRQDSESGIAAGSAGEASGVPSAAEARDAEASADRAANTGAGQSAAQNRPAANATQAQGAANVTQPQNAPRNQGAVSSQGAASATQAQNAPRNQSVASSAQRQPDPSAVAGPLAIKRGQGSIKSMALKFRGKGLYLVIEADSPMPAKYFLLHQPERLVVDLPGTWKDIRLPDVPKNLLVSNIRQGRQSDSDRLVLDLTRPLKQHSLVRLSDTRVEVVFE